MLKRAAASYMMGNHPKISRTMGNIAAQAMDKPYQASMRMPGVRSSLRSRFLAFGQPLLKAARTGIGYVKKIDDTLGNLQNQNIPLLSDAIAMGRGNPLYRGLIRGADIGTKVLDEGVELAKKADDLSEKLVDPRKFLRGAFS